MSEPAAVNSISPNAREERTTSWMIFDGASVLYVLTICISIIIILVVFVQRQVSRLRLNNSRKVPEVRLKTFASKKVCIRVQEKLKQVHSLRLSYLPKLTDCKTIGQHNNAPYLHRMIALDEITMEIDDQMERINVSYAREPGETTYKYLLRLKNDNVLPGLTHQLIQRIAYFQEAARYRPQKFDNKQLMELRFLLNTFLKIVNSEQSKISPATPQQAKGPFAQLSQWRASGGGSKRRRTQFGGSDGGRLLVVSGAASGVASREEQIALLPMGGSSNENTPTRLRRQSDSQPRINF